jgi:hypothetical protein
VRLSDMMYPPRISSRASLQAVSTFFVGDMAEDFGGSAKTVLMTLPMPSTERPSARIDSGPVVLLRLLLHGGSMSLGAERFEPVDGVREWREAGARDTVDWEAGTELVGSEDWDSPKLDYNQSENGCELSSSSSSPWDSCEGSWDG